MRTGTENIVVGTKVARKVRRVVTYHIESGPGSVTRAAYGGCSVAAAFGSSALPAALRGWEIVWRDLPVYVVEA